MPNFVKTITTLSFFSLLLIPNLNTEAASGCYIWNGNINNKTYVSCSDKRLSRNKSGKSTIQPKKRVAGKKTPNVVSTQTISGNKTDWMRQAGISESDFAAASFIINKESSWSHTAVNRKSGATGLCQSLPASKMVSAGGDYLTNPVTQLKWCDSYAKQRYGSWQKALSFWLINKWW